MPHRPQADFGQPISVDRAAVRNAGSRANGHDAPAPTETGGAIPPPFVDADDAEEPQAAEQRAEPLLTVRIVQGRPSYSEPQPEIAGVVGRATRGAAAPGAARLPPNPRDGGLT